MSEFVTDADLRSWDMLRYGYEVPSQKAKKPKKTKEIKEVEDSKSDRITKQELSKVRTYTEESAVHAALSVVTVKLGYNLVATETHTDRQQRLKGWAIFAQLIRLMLHNKFDLERVHKAISYTNKPTLSTLQLIFEDYSNSPYKLEQLTKYV